MKLATFEKDGAALVGALTADGSRLIDISAAAEGRDGGRFATMLALIEGGEAALGLAREVADRAEAAGTFGEALADVRLLAPIPVPPQIRDFSVFPGHIRQAPVGMQKLAARLQGREVPDIAPGPDVPDVYRQQPVYYITNRFSVIGPDETVRWPRYSRFMDFELEFAAIVGKGGKDIRREDAAAHIFGYTLFNDFSARDTQLSEMRGMLGPTKGKSFDMGNAMGPWIVTADEMGDIGDLKLSVCVNGETWATGTPAGMLHSFADIIAFVSRDETLHPGEVLGSGTLGNGCGLEQDRYLEDGDVVELEADRIGVLRNAVVRQD